MNINVQHHGSGAPPHNPWLVAYHFLLHNVVGLVIFAVVAVPAVGLNFGIAYLKLHGVSAYVIWVLTAVEYAVVTFDALLYIVLVGKASWKAAKELEL